MVGVRFTRFILEVKVQDLFGSLTCAEEYNVVSPIRGIYTMHSQLNRSTRAIWPYIHGPST